MKNIQILIPTRNRWEKLIKTLESIPKLSFLNILVVCDGDGKTYEKLKKRNKHRSQKVELVYLDHSGSVRARNFALIKYPPEDGLLYATDDIEFTKGSIEHAYKIFNRKFPDDDGVVGFVQDQSFHPSGVGLVGSKFLNRYPKKALFCPAYYHFACQEILRFCETFKSKKFISDPKALVNHYHPGVYKELMDQTHEEARVFKRQDRILDHDRTKRNIVWPLG